MNTDSTKDSAGLLSLLRRWIFVLGGLLATLACFVVAQATAGTVSVTFYSAAASLLVATFVALIQTATLERSLLTSVAASMTRLESSIDVIESQMTALLEPTLSRTYPDEILRVIRDDLASIAFFKRDLTYDLEILSVSRNSLDIRTRLRYTIVNRTAEPVTWTSGFVVSGTANADVEATIDGAPIDVTSKDYRSERGIYIPRTVPGRGELQVDIAATERMRLRDSELFTSFHCPATSLKVTVRNPFPEIVFDFESWLPRKVDPSGPDDCRVFTSGTAVLPYQGLRLHWHRVANNVGGQSG